MKKTLTILGIFGFVLLFAQTAANLTEFKENIASQKTEAKDALAPFRFDGSKITYFNFKTYEQVKEVEIYLFNNTDYRFSFNGKSLPNDIKVELYDKAKSEADRILLKSFSGVQGLNLLVESSELNEKFMTETGHTGRLKRVFVNYIITGIPDAEN